MKKILVVNVNWLGDVLFSTPALRALREKEPQAHISCLVLPRCEEILRNNPRICEIIIYDEYGKHRSFWAKLKFILMLRKKRFDTVFTLHPSLRRAMIGFLAGIPNRFGYNTKGRAWLLTRAVLPPDEPVHKIDYFLHLFKELEIEAFDRKYEFFISAENRKKAGELLSELKIGPEDKFVILNPGGNWALKRWPSGYFAKLGDKLINETGVRVVIVGAKKDRELAAMVKVKMNWMPNILCGKTNLGELAALMERAACVVSADSGPMHIACAVGANTVAIFGPTSPELTGPWGQEKVKVLQEDIGCAVPCYELTCTDNRCMQAVSPETVYNCVLQFINKK
ncbi:MAG: lipopolysaccharide heptosyltransferase II [Candidatus Omnitrophica bacterium]|nr:lipopolysaccharide heptosyltransferase II [Candidatus Omnitrophota bacterium]MBU1924415.1 lipopolysaccharide heptosyltransferase II [Candidatus Omnitrophota bacterium]